MELNLRKARKLESKISKLIIDERNSLNPDKLVRINADVQTEVLPELIEARQEFLDKVTNINGLIDARFLIRRLIGKSNENSGINLKINDKVILEHKLSTINAINLGTLLDDKMLEDESSALKATLENGNIKHYGGVQTNFSASFLRPQDSEALKEDKTNIVKNIETIEDELLELNYSTKIKLDVNLITLLQANSLV